MNMLFQLLGFVAEPSDSTAEQYAFNHLPLVPALSLHSHICSSRHAALWRRVSTRHQFVGYQFASNRYQSYYHVSEQESF